MLDGLAQAGRAMPFDTGPVRFVVAWTVMMAAMMLPGIVSVTAVRRDHRHPLAGAAVASGYLAVWVPTAVVAFGVLTALNEVDHPSAGLNRIGGAIVVLAGVYQFTGCKRRLLESYGGHDETFSAAGAFGTGLSHGFRCLGSSSALMSVLLVVGVMNLVWMTAISAICVGEKTLTRRAVLATAVGVALVGVGLVTLIHPQALNVIAERIGLMDGPSAMQMG